MTTGSLRSAGRELRAADGEPPATEPSPGWSQSLYRGAPGILLSHIEDARVGDGAQDLVHRWAAATTRSPVTAHPDAAGLDRGAPAVAFALHAAGQPAYAPTLATLDAHITTLTQDRLDRAHDRIEKGEHPALGEFDLVHGLTGLGAYLLHRHHGGALLREVLAYLVRLTESVPVAGETLPGWWSADGPAGRLSPDWPGGHANLGLAHGITGPLALLALTLRRRIAVTGQAEAIDRICRWLDTWRVGIGRHAWWPETVSAGERRSGTVRQPGPARPSWCYGTPGLARALQLAGLALDDPRRRRTGEEALAGCLTDEHQLGQLRDASLCHGWAGLAYTTWRVSHDATDPDMFATARLRRRLDEDLHRHGPPSGAGLLEGAAGMNLARRALTTGQPPACGWDVCLLLDSTPRWNRTHGGILVDHHDQ